jgi:hypothetical protein
MARSKCRRDIGFAMTLTQTWSPQTRSPHTVVLRAADWREYFEAIGHVEERLLADVRIGAEPVHGAHRAGGRTLHAIRYDPSTDRVEIHVGHPPPRGAFLRYFVSAPHSISVQELDGAKLIEITDACGAQTQIQVCGARLAHSP